jgi:hypothetical protein
MIDQVTLDRVRLVREMIVQYEDEIHRERDRLEVLRLEWVQVELAAEELDEQGNERDAPRLRHQAHELQHHVEATEDEIDRMEQLLAVFRRKLEEL